MHITAKLLLLGYEAASRVQENWGTGQTHFKGETGQRERKVTTSEEGRPEQGFRVKNPRRPKEEGYEKPVESAEEVA